jgi:hypothetical protein
LTTGTVKVLLDCPGVNVSVPVSRPPGPLKSTVAAAVPGSMA